MNVYTHLGCAVNSGPPDTPARLHHASTSDGTYRPPAQRGQRRAQCARQRVLQLRSLPVSKTVLARELDARSCMLVRKHQEPWRERHTSRSFPTILCRFHPHKSLVPNDIRLTELGIGTCARVVSVAAPEGGAPVELGRRLAELGFLPGEAVRIVAKGLMAKAPIAVRIGTGTFALRLFEAACIRVCPEQPQPA